MCTRVRLYRTMASTYLGLLMNEHAVVAMPGPEPPDEVKFSVTARYDDLEDVRDGALAARKFLMGGRLKFSGAYTPFLQLALELLKYLKL